MERHHDDMTLVTVATFLGLLAILAVVGDVLLIGSRAARDAVRPVALWTATAVAATATAGSLYLSEVARLEPCVLCWYQRIAMYPLVLLLGMAAVRRDASIRPYVLALAAIGALISTYHVAVQRLPGLPSGSCSLAAPCSAIQVEVFGFITIPVLALVAFLTVIVLVGLAGRTDPEEPMS
jgi:disulfide bond formation protein DsbB